MVCHVRPTGWYNTSKQRKAYKKNKWRITAYSTPCNESVELVSEGEKKRYRTILTDEK